MGPVFPQGKGPGTVIVSVHSLPATVYSTRTGRWLQLKVCIAYLPQCRHGIGHHLAILLDVLNACEHGKLV